MLLTQHTSSPCVPLTHLPSTAVLQAEALRATDAEQQLARTQEQVATLQKELARSEAAADAIEREAATLRQQVEDARSAAAGGSAPVVAAGAVSSKR